MAGARMRDHWAREQPWRADQRLWALYVTCGSIPSVVAHATQFQERLFGMRGLDLVEPRWLHLTVLGVAFVDEVDPVAMARLVEQAQAEAARIVSQARNQIQSERDAAVQSLRAEVGSLALDLASAVVTDHLASDANAKAFVDRFLADLEVEHNAVGRAQ